VRGSPRTRSWALALLALLCLAPAHAARTEEPLRRADPLHIPTGLLPEPERAANLSAVERVRAASEALREHGHAELPVLAWALLDAARDQQQAELAELAVELAPSSPGVRFEAARQLRDPLELLASLAALIWDLPGLLWLLALAGIALLGGLVALALGTCLAAALRGLPLHGHALGHAMTRQEPPAWPGVLLCLSALCALPLLGVGALGVVAAFGALGALRLPRAQTLRLALALAALGAALGPGLDRVAPAIVAGARESDLIAAWRIDQGDALPGDLERIERASARAPEDALFRYVLATDWKRRGELERMHQALGDPTTSSEPALRAASFNLRGIARLAEGDLAQAVPAFERARSASESAAVLFNLSQAYGRALLLKEQEAAFAAASSLDDAMVNRYLAAEGANLHSVLIQTPLAIAIFLARALEPTPESRALAGQLREGLLGPLERDRLWLALPALGALALLLRRSSVTRCSRCKRPLCASCSREAMAAGTCMRCVRLFVRREHTDPRMRKAQLEKDRRRERWAQVRLAAGALVMPGSADVVEGRWLRGTASLFALGLAAGLVRAPELLPLPWDLGALGQSAPYALGLTLLAGLYAMALVQSVSRLSNARRAA
jgi:tetratricopeptide (TPR) repeat protein